MHYKGYNYYNCGIDFHVSIVGSVVEWSPATRSARVRFPDDAVLLFGGLDQSSFIYFNSQFLGLVFFCSGCKIQFQFVLLINTKKDGQKESCGGAGYRSPHLSHACYHLSYAPNLIGQDLQGLNEVNRALK
jgi:hypothetical protein